MGQVWRRGQAPSTGIKGGDKPDLDGRKIGGRNGCHRLQSMVAACCTSEVVTSKALVRGGGGVDWSRAMGSEPRGRGCL
jgi:hypothetical protein